jgi:branched-subunit amino acid transport protein AzlD
MSVLLTVVVVGMGSLLFRLVPLLGARRLPERLTTVAGWTGLCLLAALTVRTVVQHQDPSLPGAPGLPAVVAAVSVGAGLVLAFRGRSALLAVTAGGATYVVLSALLTTLA